MPRKSDEQKAGEARQRWEERLSEARREYADDPDAIAGPLGVTLRWLQAALKQRADLGKRNAPELYKSATDQIAAYARRVHEQTENGK